MDRTIRIIFFVAMLCGFSWISLNFYILRDFQPSEISDNYYVITSNEKIRVGLQEYLAFNASKYGFFINLILAAVAQFLSKGNRR
jgi:hypothetical protein